MFSDRNTILCGFALALLLSCSVKENREDCLRLLLIDYEDASGKGFTPFVICGISEKASVQMTARLPDSLLTFYFAEGDLNVAAAYPDGIGFGIDSDGMRITPGEDCPEIWLWRGQYEMKAEITCDTVRFRKNYCRIGLELKNAGPDSKPLSLSFKGNVCGYNLRCEPVDGDFRYDTALEPGGACSAAIPRQKDNSLILDICDSGEVIRTFALGEYISASGYDWKAADLNDLSVSIDFAVTEITLSNGLWNRTFAFELLL